MIPETYLLEWHQKAPWRNLHMVEQDLILNRVLCCIYSHPLLSKKLIFRGGTALNKIYITPPARYSEDIDFVQKNAEPIGETLNTIRDVLQDWLGDPAWLLTERSAKLFYKYTNIEGFTSKIKIEINTTEHFNVLPICEAPLSTHSGWFTGDCTLKTYALEELMATKLRALYQRRKGRDLFDLWFVFNNTPADLKKTLTVFKAYAAYGKLEISADLFKKNLDKKRLNHDFQTDMDILLPQTLHWNFEEAFEFVKLNIIDKII